MAKSVVSTEQAPAPLGGAPYSQAIVAAGLVFAAGQVPLDPATGELVDGGIDAQTHRCIDNVEAILRAAGTGLDRIVKTTVFMTDLHEFGAMNHVYAQRIPAPFPARSTIEVSRLPAGARVEIEVVALAP